MSMQMKKKEAMYSINKSFQGHNLKIWVKKNSKNGRKTWMQASAHYFTTQIYIFLLHNNLKDNFSFALGYPLFRMSLWLHTSEKTKGMFNWQNYIFGEISLLHYIKYKQADTH